MRVLLVEDHRELAETIATVLRREGLAVDVAFDGRQALAQTGVYDYDVIVLDRDLPGVHGDQVCRTLIDQGSQSKVLMLTAADALEDRVEGLGLGADDYLTKPFAFAELIARIRAINRRSGPPLPPVLARGDLRLDPALRVATRRGHRLALSPKELAVLEYLLTAHGRVVSAEELLG
ncbi:MAG: response regulator transcription factor, partial [Solirubrobacterales bacterium]|nr:response regulator transcription factor [Solirubrobacterales bacterium]